MTNAFIRRGFLEIGTQRGALVKTQGGENGRKKGSGETNPDYTLVFGLLISRTMRKQVSVV